MFDDKNVRAIEINLEIWMVLLLCLCQSIIGFSLQT